MKIPPSYTITKEMLELISKIDAYRLFFNSLEIPIQVKDKIQRVSLLKSSVFSARIEGNPLTFEDIELNPLDLQNGQSDKQKKIEILNILSAMRLIDTVVRPMRAITKIFLLQLHSLVMKDISSTRGKFRHEMSAIFNQAGVAIYLSPPPEKVSILLDRLIKYTNTTDENFPLVAASITHLLFEKIHPFIDGNGRVGRLLVFAVLKSHGYNFGFFIPFEEYIEQHKEEYYYYVDIGLRNATDYICFMLSAFSAQCEKIKDTIFRHLQSRETLLLPPRQEEIFTIIKDHRVVSFDFLQRRLLKVPARTLRYDLQKLQKSGLILKIGKTKGSYYKVKV